MTRTQTFDDTFDRSATSAGAAGTPASLCNGWFDVNGTIFSFSGTYGVVGYSTSGVAARPAAGRPTKKTNKENK